MGKFWITLCFILAVFWGIIALFVGIQTFDEKRNTKDGSWKFFLAIFIFILITALSLIGVGIHISITK
jgi:hypothetical protein